ncbi:type VI secretion system tube protein TssD [Olivibacter sp. CPCC 100613]|uniref:type VI secretion system tube protein TssD n=1 Tax=Olivibacter sp. CPCC 100613 TaxID=3079931 RepID=UPI002FF8E305
MFLVFQGFAQQGNRTITLKLTDPKTKKSQNYLLNSFAYSCTRPRGDNQSLQYSPYDVYIVSVDFQQNADEFLLKWIGGQMNKADGVITVETKGNNESMRTITFRDALVGATSESFSSGEGYGYASTQVSIYIDNLTIDNVPIQYAAVDAKGN